MEKTVKIALCDDDKKDRDSIYKALTEYLDHNDLYAQIDVFDSGEQFLCGDTMQYDLVFFDIFMGGINGMETAKKLIAQNKKVQIIFASTSTEYAAEAFSIEALHYLVKPIDTEQFWRMLDKFFQSFHDLSMIDIKVGRMEESIFISDILYIEADGKRTRIFTKNGMILCSQSLAEMANLVPQGQFCMPIRWALVPMKEIVNLQTNELTLSDGTKIPISRSKREEIKDTFAQFRWNEMRRRTRGRAV